MMKRLICLSILLLLTIMCIFSGTGVNDERVWFFNDGGAYNITSVDLSKTFYAPTYQKGYKDVSNETNGHYGQLLNGVGNFGCAYTDETITFTISTDGRFVCQSDPTKYREFAIAIKPRYRYVGASDDENWNWEYPGTPSGDSRPTYRPVADLYARVPHTEPGVPGTLTINSPLLTRAGKNNYSEVDVDGTIQKVERWFGDLCIVMDPVENDQSHLVNGNDYIATILITWTCPNGSACEKSDIHSGSYILALKGNYVTSKNDESIYLNVTPDPASMDLDLKNIIGQETHISDVELYAFTRKNTSWENKIAFFLSASSQIDVQPANGFRLYNKSNGFYIPYELVVREYSMITGAPTGKVVTFDGTEYASGSTTNSGKKVDISKAANNLYISGNKQGQTIYSATYGGHVYIVLDDTAYADRNFYNKNHEYPYQNNATDVPVDILDYSLSGYDISGVYTSTIYYYVIYN